MLVQAQVQAHKRMISSSFGLLDYQSQTKSSTALSLSLICLLLLSTTTTAFSVMSPSSSSSQSPSLTSTLPSQQEQEQQGTDLPPPIVYTIAGSDSGGGAGIQADLHAIHAMACHGCSAITCLTAQSSTGVIGVHTPPVDFLKLQLRALTEDLYPRAIKVGMLGSQDLALEVGLFLKGLKEGGEGAQETERPFVVLDPVMISTSGHKLIEDEAKEVIIESVFPYVDVVTPNKFEAEELLGRKLTSPEDVETGAREILNMGVKAVLIKGGHSLAESQKRIDGDAGADDNTDNVTSGLSEGVKKTLGYAQDYFLSSEGPLTPGEERICDGSRGVWLRADRYDTIHTHGTGCTLSSVIASALALGHQQRSINNTDGGGTGATRAIHMIDACCLAKAYVTEGVGRGMQLGSGPGPVAHTSFPFSHKSFPSVALDPRDGASAPFLKMQSAKAANCSNDGGGVITLGKLLPIVNNKEWVERLSPLEKITDIQLRIKDQHDQDEIVKIVEDCQKICDKNNVRLWINDYWRAAVKAKCFGVHVGQEDLAKCIDDGGLDSIRENNLALGISTHSYAELAAALGVKPSYISLGPVFGTNSKNVAFYPQTLDTVKRWRDLICPDVPVVAIGGINDATTASHVKEAGADCVAVIGAITKSDDINDAVNLLYSAME